MVLGKNNSQQLKTTSLFLYDEKQHAFDPIMQLSFNSIKLALEVNGQKKLFKNLPDSS